MSFLLPCHFDTGLAYIDPNTGGALFQLLFPLFLAISGAWMLLRKKIAAFRQRLGSRKDPKDKPRK